MSAWLIACCLLAQDRPSEADLFGEPAPDAGPEESTAARSEPLDAGANRDELQLAQGPTTNRFESGEAKADPLVLGANLLSTLQAFFLDGQSALEASVSAPNVLDTWLDGRPSDRLRVYAVGRLQSDPTQPLGDRTASPGGAQTPAGAGPGVTGAAQSNPAVFLDQLWLSFDIQRRLYLTVGRQKVRWGTARIWYPTDFLNTRPRDALNPFDARLGVDLVKVHLPIESLGWNFYGYGILDNLAAGAGGLTLDRVGGAARAELVLGPAEIALGGVWMRGRRPRYAVQLSTPVGPLDVYAEAALRDGRDFLQYQLPSDLAPTELRDRVLLWLAERERVRQEGGDPASVPPVLTARRPTHLVVQASGGVSYQFNYTDSNTASVAAEYFYNPMGYHNPWGFSGGATGINGGAGPEEYLFLAQTIPSVFGGDQPDPIQQVPLYGGRHSVALMASTPGLPDLPWISLSLVNLLSLSDPAGMLRIDASFRVLTYLTVQAFGAVFYGQTGGELRFRVPASIRPYIPSAPPALTHAPLAHVGLLLRVSI